MNNKTFPVDSIFGLCQKHGVLFNKVNGLILLKKDDLEIFMSPQTSFKNALRIIVDKFNIGESEYERLINNYDDIDHQLTLF